MSTNPLANMPAGGECRLQRIKRRAARKVADASMHRFFVAEDGLNGCGGFGVLAILWISVGATQARAFADAFD
jgi:hypothetical protein